MWLWRDASLQVKMLKSWRELRLLWEIMVKKMNAAVAWRRLASQNWKKESSVIKKTRAALMFAVPLPNQTRSLGCSARTFATSSSSFLPKGYGVQQEVEHCTLAAIGDGPVVHCLAQDIWVYPHHTNVFFRCPQQTMTAPQSWAWITLLWKVLGERSKRKRLHALRTTSQPPSRAHTVGLVRRWFAE